jgi:hypothetical protein
MLFVIVYKYSRNTSNLVSKPEFQICFLTYTMATASSYIPHCRILVVLIVAGVHVFCCGASDEGKDVYIVHMGSLLEGEYSTASLHLSVLQEVLGERYIK